MDNLELVASIGDIQVLSLGELAIVTVDDKTVLSIPKHGHGLNDLVKALSSLVKEYP